MDVGFISFAHDDNTPWEEGGKGWVDEFDYFLNTKLREHTGNKEIRIWRDPYLKSGDDWNEKILETVREAQVLVCVVSNLFANSAYCKKEVAEFLAEAETRGDLRIGNKYRVFPVVKLPLDGRWEKPFDLLEKAQVVQLYLKERGVARSVTLLLKAERDWFIRGVEDVAIGIKEVLELLSKPGREPIKPPPAKTVYLAETTGTLKPLRDQIRWELERGYRILPAEALPKDEGELNDTIAGYLDQCQISIHLIELNNGEVPKNGTSSLVSLQHELAVKSKLPRIIWVQWPPGPKDKGSITLRDHLLQQEGTDKIVDVLECSEESPQTLENLKTVLQDRLNQLERPATILKRVPEPPEPQTRPSDHVKVPRIINLICSKDDREAASEVADALTRVGLEVRQPRFDQELRQRDEAHHSKLIDRDDTLIYWGFAPLQWIVINLPELHRTLKVDRTKPAMRRMIFVGPPDRPGKRNFPLADVKVIKQCGERFSAEDKAAILENLAQA